LVRLATASGIIKRRQDLDNLKAIISIIKALKRYFWHFGAIFMPKLNVD
jgi:hypothetical protein